MATQLKQSVGQTNDSAAAIGRLQFEHRHDIIIFQKTNDFIQASLTLLGFMIPRKRLREFYDVYPGHFHIKNALKCYDRTNNMCDNNSHNISVYKYV